jgi:cell division protein ZapA
MKQVETTILGQSYMLACPPDGEALLREAVAIVDREMSAIRDAGKVKARERIAVLTALNLAYQRAEQARAPLPSSPVAGATAGSAGGSAVDADAPDIEHLIRRIDSALGNDGLLL